MAPPWKCKNDWMYVKRLITRIPINLPTTRQHWFISICHRTKNCNETIARGIQITTPKMYDTLKTFNMAGGSIFVVSHNKDGHLHVVGETVNV